MTRPSAVITEIVPTQGAMSRKRETFVIICDLCKSMLLRTVLQCFDTKGYGLLTALTC